MTHPEMELVPLGVGHLDDVAHLEAQASPAPWPRDLFAGELDLPAGRRHWLVAELDGAVVGFAGMMIVDDEAHLMNIAVASEYQRRGIARKLLGRLISDVLGFGVRNLTLEVRLDNTAALALYSDFGMTPDGTRKDYYGPGADALILWVRRIDEPDYRRRVGLPPAPALSNPDATSGDLP